ncbi:hypothetical protein [Sphingomonas sp. 8AM]|uniref:hypothetical protein n=1 Tax=Sphingomonas sp. 8AM TaxID=2653170 RepID=UPI0013592A60|nr:hypothetical protein [Sphingomonas sp. 8AM]
MDMNELYRVHQILITQATNAASIEARISHAGRASGYAALIAEKQLTFGVDRPTLVSSS